MIKLTIPLIPPSPNVIKRKYRNPHVYKRLRDTWAWELLAAANTLARNLRFFYNRQRPMSIGILITHKRLFDPDNLVGSVKLILDALREARLLYQDSPQFLELHVEQERSAKRETMITIEPCRTCANARQRTRR